MGCGGDSRESSTGGGGGTNAVPAVTLVANPTSINAGGSSTLTMTSTNATQVALTGSDGTSYTFPAASAGTKTVSPSSTVTYTATASGAGGSATAQATVTVNAAQNPTVTSVAASCAASTVAPGGSTQCTATVNGTGNYPTTVNWSSTPATAGTIASSGMFTASSTLSQTTAATITACSALSDYTTVCGSATVTVTVEVSEEAPTVTSISPNFVYDDGSVGIVANVHMTGTNFEDNGTATVTPASCCLIQGAVYNSAESVLLYLGFGGDNTNSPGFFLFGDCDPNGGLCSTPGPSSAIAYVGSQDYLAASSAGELFFLDQAQGLSSGPQGYVRKYTSLGVSDGSFLVGAGVHSIAVDDLTGNVILDGGDYDEDDATVVPEPTGVPAGTVSKASAARNGYGCAVQPGNNSAYCYDLVGNGAATPAAMFASKTLGSYPTAIAMGVFNGETDAYIASVNGTPTLWKMNAANGTVESSVALSGITPMSTVQSANPVMGGWYVAVIGSGSASGTVAILSTPDNLLLFVNPSTMQVTGTVALTGKNLPAGTPFGVKANPADDTFIVKYANLTNATTTYAVVTTAGTVTALQSTDTLLSVGFLPSSDGSKIYSGQRGSLDVLANQ